MYCNLAGLVCFFTRLTRNYILTKAGPTVSHVFLTPKHQSAHSSLLFQGWGWKFPGRIFPKILAHTHWVLTCTTMYLALGFFPLPSTTHSHLPKLRIHKRPCFLTQEVGLFGALFSSISDGFSLQSCGLCVLQLPLFVILPCARRHNFYSPKYICIHTKRSNTQYAMSLTYKEVCIYQLDLLTRANSILFYAYLAPTLLIPNPTSSNA